MINGTIYYFKISIKTITRLDNIQDFLFSLTHGSLSDNLKEGTTRLFDMFNMIIFDCIKNPLFPKITWCKLEDEL